MCDDEELLREGGLWVCRNCGTTLQIDSIIDIMVNYIPVEIDKDTLRTQMYTVFLINNEQKTDIDADK